MKDINGIRVTMPFYHIKKSDEIQIESSEIIYSEINNCGYGMQLNNPKIKNEAKELCFEISKKIKELNNLLTQ